MFRFVMLTGGGWTSPIEFVARSSMLFAVTWLLTASLRRHSAATRHLLWLTATVAVLAIPMIQMVTPGWQVLPAEFRLLELHPVVEFAAGSDPVERATSTSVTLHSRSHEDEPAATTPWSPVASAFIAQETRNVSDLNFCWPALVTIVWCLGALLFSLPVILGTVRIGMLRRTDQVVPGILVQEVQHLSLATGVFRTIEVVLSASCGMPMTWGVLRPVILLPSDVMEWSVERRRMVLLHELAHIRRWDCLTQVLGQIARALHWFNPLAWLALRQLRIEQECACDDIVLNFGANAEDYAAELLSVTAHVPRDSWDAAVALAMNRTSRIECRLNAILNSGAERRPLSPGRALAIISVVSLLAIGIAAARPQPTAAADINAVVTQEDLPDDAPLVNPTRLKPVEPAEQDRPNVAAEVSAVAPENKVETEISQASDTPKVPKPVVEPGFENGDFETDKVFHGIPPAAIPEKQCANSKYVRLALEQEGHSSPHSASITIDPAHPPDHVTYSWLTRLRGWKPEQALEISAWVKTRDVKTSPGLSVHCWGKHMSLLAVASTLDKSNVTGTTDWVRLSTLVIVPQETDQIQIRAFLTMPDNGGAKVCFDDFKAVEADVATAKATMRHLSLIERAPRNIEILRSPWTPGRQSSWSAEIDGGTYRCQIYPSYLGPKTPPRAGTENQPVQRIWYQSVTEINGGSRYPVPRMSIHLEKIDRDPDTNNLNP